LVQKPKKALCKLIQKVPKMLICVFTTLFGNENKIGYLRNNLNEKETEI
jgi:hypothetical protein